MPDTDTFQHYQVLKRPDGSSWELGRGAMGVTFKAFDTSLRCHVALKVINAAYLDSEMAQQRFLREARAAAGLSHPNVASVFHLGESGGNYFYAMEFIDGETLETFVSRTGPLRPLPALQIALQVTRALRAAARAGLVHRDIKPANLMLLRHEEEDEFQVKVIDFGLAKVPAREGDAAGSITVAGFAGTPHFASPEQLEEKDLDVRSDMYSLGVCLWYMLAGRPPFAGSVVQIMSQQLTRQPPFELLPGLPPEVVRLLEHLLEKDPGKRPQTPADLRKEIESAIKALPDSTAASAKVFSWRHVFFPAVTRVSVWGARFGLPRLAVSIVGLGLLITLLAVGGVWGMRSLPRRQRARVFISAGPRPSPTQTPLGTAAPAASAPPGVSRSDLFRDLLAQAQTLDRAGDAAGALDAYVALARDYPEQSQGLSRVDSFISGLRAAPLAADAEQRRGEQLRALMEGAAALGSTPAMLYLGDHLLATAAPTAVKWYARAANKGEPEAMFALGNLYFDGTGVPKQPAEASRWFARASDRGYVRAKIYLAECYEEGKGGVPRDFDKAFGLLNEALALEPRNPVATEKLAIDYERGRGTPVDTPKAFELMKRAVELGDVNAMGNLGVYYMNGLGGTRKDPRAAVALFKEGAGKNNAACMFFYARCLYDGVGGLAANRAEAVSYYRAAAERGFEPARGWCRENGVSFAGG
jgi:TPR repeat protein/tRNA A-37 threonylcarbamoyl transferase component Bud32